jgi:hypothetical protein
MIYKHALEELHSRLQPSKLVIITHSLGAKVALEAFDQLRRRESDGWITGTLLVQSAVTIMSIVAVDFPGGMAYRALPKSTSKGPVYPNSPRDHLYWDGPKMPYWIEAHREEGEYFKACGFSPKVVATMSPMDAALSVFFSLLSRGKIFDLTSFDFDLLRAVGAMRNPQPQLGINDFKYSYFWHGPPNGKMIYPPNVTIVPYLTDNKIIALDFLTCMSTCGYSATQL